MSKAIEAGTRHLAHAELVSAMGAAAIGAFVEATQEDDNTTTYLFEVALKGYVGWRWSVTIFQASKRENATISEVLMVPGPDSLVAPDWVPWSERLADWKALQAELERQAAEEAAEAAESEDDAEEESEGSDADSVEEVTDAEAENEAAETDEDSESTTDVPDAVDAENSASDAGPNNPRGRGRRRWFGRKKNG